MAPSLLHDAIEVGTLKNVQDALNQLGRIDVNAENKAGKSALEIATRLRTDVEILLMENPQVQHYVDGLYRDRQVNVDAANAILVGTTLIASITYSAWLLLPSSTDTMNATAVNAFWAFNSLSFYFAVATVFYGAYATMPMFHHEFIRGVTKKVKAKVFWASILLMFSVLCVLGAFTIGAFARLPAHTRKELKILSTAPIGFFIYILVLGLIFGKLTGLTECIKRKYHARFGNQLSKNKNSAMNIQNALMNL
jgi:hypothetical protein